MIPFYISLFVTFLIFTEYFLAYLIKILYVTNLKVITKGKLVLTFDDGPGERLQQKILDILSEHDVKATFFLNAERAARYPEAMKILSESRNELALHCYKHVHAWRVPPYKVINDILKGYRVLGGFLTNYTLLRFPYGKMTLSTYLYFKIKGKKPAFWTHDSGDTHVKLPTVDSIVESIVASNGAVVLMHSFDRDVVNIYREDYIISLIKNIIEQATKKKWNICTLSELWSNTSKFNDYRAY